MKFIVTTIYPSRQSLLETEQLLIFVSMLPLAFVCPCSKFDDGWDTLLDADNDLDKFKEALETFGHSDIKWDVRISSANQNHALEHLDLTIYILKES